MKSFHLSVLVVLFSAALCYSQSPRASNMADPNDPTRTRVVIPRSEREKLGLETKTWTGVVAPDVYARLDALNKVIATTKERLSKGKDREALSILTGTKFEGTVYVQVQLRSKDAQRRVLTSLKASEFHPEHIFDGAPGFVGYARKEALDTLAKHPEVVGICLDNKPLPDRRKIIVKDSLPPLKSGDTSNDQPGVKERKVDADIYRAFAQSERVDVLIGLRAESVPRLTVDSESKLLTMEGNKAERQLQNSVLAILTADDIWVYSKTGLCIYASITEHGLQKLWKHPDVSNVSMQLLLKIPERKEGIRLK